MSNIFVNSSADPYVCLRLLNRTTRHISPTEEGRAFYEHCARITAEIEEAAEAVTALQRHVRGTLQRRHVPLKVRAFVDFLAYGGARKGDRNRKCVA